jgi:hypothetical protein
MAEEKKVETTATVPADTHTKEVPKVEVKK